MRILITGVSGLLGSELSRVLNEKGHTVTVFKHRLEDKNIEKKYRGPYDWVIHAAAMTTVDQCEKEREKCWEVNALGTRKMRDVAKKAGARFLYISTASVFLGDTGNYREDDRPYPQNFYNLSKFAGEIFAGEYEKSTIVRLVILGIHPDGSRGRNFVEWLVDSFSANKDVKLFNDVIINPLSSVTTAELIEKILVAKKHVPIIHLTSKDRLSKAAVGKLILKKFPKYTGTIEEVSSETRSATLHPKEIWLNSDATAKSFDIKRPRIEDEIRTIFSSNS